MASFDKFAERLEKEKFEAPTAVQLEDGNWNLFRIIMEIKKIYRDIFLLKEKN